MTDKRFNNIPSDRIQIRHTTQEGTKIVDYYMSRAIAVVGVVFAITEKETYVLTVLRSEKMRDEANKIGVICGYLDYNETCYEGITREIYEETSLYLPDYNKYLIFDNNKQPFYVQDDPKKDKNQNVSLTYLLAFDFSSNPEAFPNEIEKYTDHETAEVKWLIFTDFYNETREWAFNHDERIRTAHKYFNSNFDEKRKI